MIFVDTSTWIEYFNGTISAKTDYLHESLSKKVVIVGDIVLMEVLQGIRNEKQYHKTKSYLEATIQVQMIDPSLAVTYADYYRTLRKKGITIRKTNDVIVAGYCIINDLPLLQNDRDFKPFEQYLGLKLLG